MSTKLRMFTRMMSSSTRVPQVCIVGAGPAGFYAAMRLTKKLANVHVDIIEKLPVPFGLIRYGVAPDHPEVKNVINQFTKVAQQDNVNFYGNITVGKDVTLPQLRQNYDAVLLTYGAEEDKELGIQNEDARNVIAARNFVGWYNGLPSDKDLQVDLSNDTAAVLGQGNVALDVARILLSPIDKLKKTDITQHALDALAESKIRNLYLIGRRGPLQVAFTIKELREQLKMKDCSTIWRESDFAGVADVVANLPRPRKRLTELMLKSLEENKLKKEDTNSKRLYPIFLRSPNKFITDKDNVVKGIELFENRLYGKGNVEEQKCVSTNEMELLDCGLALRSIGYKSVSIDEELELLPQGMVNNDKGRIWDAHPRLAKMYAAGWLGTGPVGVILHTMGNAFQVANMMYEDLSKLPRSRARGGFEEIKRILRNEIVDWEGWSKIDRYEIEQGKKMGKPREKICDIGKMMEIAYS
ncbi:NADPH:adrenodoxin oxidoreductase, mitochondrial [Leguminivora glycinivorella]|uniref:NADPH:adrenodoxin oxidoreductase, mitochondrial n=1 Tax=Leguminivora glycinivorella TaxID=1035111 RepID=UPI00200BC92F|nr:NADPH:adrenodoxin oxidoreductase, mitochondrial [Leguminivora glycinivorella]